MKKIVLSLDLGTKTGWTLDGMNGYTHKLSQKDDKYAQLYNFIETHIQNGVELVVYEDAGFQQFAAAPIFHGLAGVLKAVTARNGVPFIAIPVGTIKKTFLGKARHTKEEQQAAADKLGLKKANTKSKTLEMCTKLCYHYDGEDAADALSVAYTYRKLYGSI